MVFPSVPLYLDPPNWNQQGSIDGSSNVHQLGELTAAEAGGGGGAARPSGSMAERARLAKVPQPDGTLKCPRCDSPNTKFCYFNNYSLTQPRHFCKTCRRYWTRGGALRSVPVGGGCRRNKRSGTINKPSSSSSKTSSIPAAVPTSSVSTSSVAAGMMFRSAPPPFFAPPWEYGYGGIQPATLQIDAAAEGMGLEQWKIQQIQQSPFLGGFSEPSVQATAVPPSLYPFEGEFVDVHGQGEVQLHGKSSSVKMEELMSSRTATVINLPRQFLGGGSGGGHGGRWISGDHLSGFSSSSTGNYGQ